MNASYLLLIFQATLTIAVVDGVFALASKLCDTTATHLRYFVAAQLCVILYAHPHTA